MGSISAIVDTLLFERDSKNNGGKKVKEILVIDAPDICYKCPCYDHEGGICQAESNWKTDRQNGCPLKPIPSKEELISKILFEVDGGTDDRYISYYDICQRVEKSVNDWFEEIENG